MARELLRRPKRAVATDGQSGPLRVLVVVDVGLYRDAVVEHLERQATIAVVGSALHLEEGLSAIRDVQPDVVLVDARYREAIPAASLAADEYGGADFVVLGVDEDEDDIVECAQLGAAGYFGRGTPIESLVPTIESVVRDEMICSPRVAAMLFRRAAASGSRRFRPTAPYPRLSGRERTVIGLIAEGLSNKEIARELHIAVSTVKNHVHNILRKLGTHRREEAAELALRAERLRLAVARDPAQDVDPHVARR
jgi:DNA-binding NarL/FixJ family response regulator